MLYINCLRTIAAVAATLTLAAPAAHAQTFYNEPAPYNIAATTAITYTFEGIAPPNDAVTNPALLTTPAIGQVTFSVIGGDDTNIYATDSAVSFGDFCLSDGTDSVVAGFPQLAGSTTTIALGGSFTAFAIEYGMANNAAKSFTFALFNGNTQVGNSRSVGSIGGDRFFGVTSATPFNNVRVIAPSGGIRYMVFDNARVGSSVAVVPEAGTVALLLPTLAGLGTILAVRRRK